MLAKVAPRRTGTGHRELPCPRDTMSRDRLVRPRLGPSQVTRVAPGSSMHQVCTPQRRRDFDEKVPELFTASGFDALEGRVVLSHGAASAATGVIHGHKAQHGRLTPRISEFYNNTDHPAGQDSRSRIAATPSEPGLQRRGAASRWSDHLSMVNGLAQPVCSPSSRPKMYSRIPTQLDDRGIGPGHGAAFASTSPSPARRFLATLNSLSNDALAQPGSGQQPDHASTRTR